MSMKIYVSHSRKFAFKEELYAPLRASRLNAQHHIILPHESSDEDLFPSGDIIPTCDLVIAEVSFPSTGQGIELGWAHAAGVPIVCIHKQGSQPSNSLTAVTDVFLWYDDPKEVIEALTKALRKLDET